MATDHPPVPTARQVAERFVTAGVDPGTHELYKLYALSVVIEMPFAPPGMPKRYETSRDELAARFSAPSPRRYEEDAPSVPRISGPVVAAWTSMAYASTAAARS